MLTADPGTWTGTQPLTFTYQWWRCDSNSNNCSNIIGATSKTYTLTSIDVGNRLRVRVRASNSAGAGQAGESVTITQHRLPSIGGLQVQTLSTVQTAADGSFSLNVRPLIHTIYKATTAQTGSNTVSVQVRPRLSLTRIGAHRFLARVVAARSFAGRYGVVQRWSLRRHHWTSVRRVFFSRALVTVSPTVVSRTTFRARFGGARIRVLIPRSQTPPGLPDGFQQPRASLARQEPAGCARISGRSPLA